MESYNPIIDKNTSPEDSAMAGMPMSVVRAHQIKMAQDKRCEQPTAEQKKLMDKVFDGALPPKELPNERCVIEGDGSGEALPEIDIHPFFGEEIHGHPPVKNPGGLPSI